MEEKIYQSLLRLLGKTTISELTLRGKASRLAKTIISDEMLTDDALQEDVTELKLWQGELNHILASKSKGETKVASNEEKDKQKSKPLSNSNEEHEKRILELETRLSTFVKEREEELNKMKENNLKAAVREVLTKSGCTDTLLLDLAFFTNPVKMEISVEDNVKNLRAWYDETMAERVKQGLVPQGAIIAPIAALTPEQREQAAKARAERASKFDV